MNPVQELEREAEAAHARIDISGSVGVSTPSGEPQSMQTELRQLLDAVQQIAEAVKGVVKA